MIDTQQQAIIDALHAVYPCEVEIRSVYRYPDGYGFVGPMPWGPKVGIEVHAAEIYLGDKAYDWRQIILTEKLRFPDQIPALLANSFREALERMKGNTHAAQKG